MDVILLKLLYVDSSIGLKHKSSKLYFNVSLC